MSSATIQNKSMANAAMWVLLVTIVSKVIGFTESAIAASLFGTTAEVDMFYLASTIANRFVFTIFSGLSVVGLTMYNGARFERGEDQGNRFVSALVACVIPLAIVVTAFIYFAAPLISDIMAANYGEAERSILVKYLRELSCISVFYAFTTIFTCVLNANKKFLPGVSVGIIQNLSMIVFMLVLSKRIGVNSIVLGLVVAYVLQAGFLYFVARSVIRFRSFSLKEDIDIKKILLLIAPLVLGEATGEINTLVDQYLATNQGEGYVAGLTYSETLNDVVTALFIQTITTVLLAYFSELAVQKKYGDMLEELKTILKLLTLVLIPVSIVTVVGAEHIVSVIFERGKFGSESVRITSLALIGYGFGFVFKTIMVIVKRPFFAINNTKIPMMMGVVNVAINISLSIVLSHYYGIIGITLATSLSYLLICAIYFCILSHTFVEMNWTDCVLFYKKVVIALVITGFCSYFLSRIDMVNHFVSLCVLTAACFFIFGGVLYFLKLNELSLAYDKVIIKIKEFRK